MIKYVWVVEMYNSEKKRWKLCAGYALNKEDGKSAKIVWQHKNPDWHVAEALLGHFSNNEK